MLEIIAFGTRSSYINGEQSVFRELLDFWINNSDIILIKHFKIFPKNFTMISPKVQNKIINDIDNIIIGKIVERFKQFQIFFFNTV